MNLGDVVTRSLAPESCENDSVLEIWQSPMRMSPDECLEAMRAYRERLQNISRQEVLQETARALLALRGLHEPFHTHYFMYALDYQEEGTPASLQYLQEGADEWIERIERQERQALLEATIGNTGNQIDYLREIWRDDLPRILATLTGKTLQTARCWTKGRRPQKISANQIYCLASCAFVLCHEGGWSAGEIRLWAENDQEGPSPLQEMQNPLAVLMIPGILSRAKRPLAGSA